MPVRHGETISRSILLPFDYPERALYSAPDGRRRRPLDDGQSGQPMLLTIRKVGEVLGLFTRDAPEWGVSSAAAALGSPRSSTHALLSSLADIGLLRNSGNGRYRLGWRIAELSEMLDTSSRLREHAYDHMRRFTRDFHETINLAVLDRDKTLLIEKIVSEQPITVRGAPVGARMEPVVTAFGRVLLAFADEFAGPPHAHFPLGNGSDLVFDLAEIRRNGYASDNGEFDTDRRCVAAPIRDEFDRTIAAVSVTAPTSRFLPRAAELTAAIQATAQHISRSFLESSQPPG